jgi:hypothetical protein
MRVLADAPNTADWIQAWANVAAVAVTLVGLVFIGHYLTGYRLRLRGWIDQQDVVVLRAFNWGRLDGGINSVAVVIRWSLSARVLRWAVRKDRSDNVVEPILLVPTVIRAGVMETWYQSIDLKKQPMLPVRWHPFKNRERRLPRRGELVVRTDLGMSRVRKVRYINLRSFAGNLGVPAPTAQPPIPSPSHRSAFDACLQVIETYAQACREGILQEGEIKDQRKAVLSEAIDQMTASLDTNDQPEATKQRLDNLLDVLRAITALRREGAISRDEYNQHKAKLVPHLK